MSSSGVNFPLTSAVMSDFFPGYTRLPTWLTTDQDLVRSKANLVSFVFKGQREALKGICQDWFNHPSNKQLKFKPYSNLVLVSFLNCYCSTGRKKGDDWDPCSHRECPKAELKDENNQTIGIFKYHSLHFTILIEASDGQVYAFSPYSFIDETTAIVYAREIFGQTMTLADFYHPGYDKKAKKHPFHLHMEVDDVTDYTTGLNVNQKAPMVTITPIEDPKSEASLKPSYFHEHQGMAKIPHLIRKQLQEETGREYKRSELKHLFAAGSGKIKLVALRQFRGTASGDRAVLKSVVSFLPTSTKVHRLGWLPGQYNLHLPIANPIIGNHFPIGQTLGLEENSTSLAAFEATLDFQYRPYKSLWNARDHRSI